eukprot:scaffold7418_cov77-Cyclotella_meneghiniana.AAC.2
MENKTTKLNVLLCIKKYYYCPACISNHLQCTVDGSTDTDITQHPYLISQATLLLLRVLVGSQIQITCGVVMTLCRHSIAIG